ncbi:hypothetical protein CHARACLAT_013351 [Characodon lateralis]|uniref:Secreted protein n=1 Tax=Characodon lateralis TaxID=208331 RepID=A0ABU7E0Y1_9TELE|nr:hypothetical protein [Characodon lateralis]
MSTFTVLNVFLAPRLLRALRFVCLRGGRRCVRLQLESLQKINHHLLPSLLLLFSPFGGSVSSPPLFVPALILLSKPWLASLTAAEHRLQDYWWPPSGHPSYKFLEASRRLTLNGV